MLKNEDTDYLPRKTDLILFRSKRRGYQAVALDDIYKLERVHLNDIRDDGEKRFTDYEGEELPLVVPASPVSPDRHGKFAIVVLKSERQMVGLVVEEIVDFLEFSVVVDGNFDHQSIVGRTVYNGQSVEVVDAGFFVDLALATAFSLDPEAIGAGSL